MDGALMVFLTLPTANVYMGSTKAAGRMTEQMAVASRSDGIGGGSAAIERSKAK
jgi:hypothetical protein